MAGNSLIKLKNRESFNEMNNKYLITIDIEKKMINFYQLIIITSYKKHIFYIFIYFIRGCNYQ